MQEFAQKQIKTDSFHPIAYARSLEMLRQTHDSNPLAREQAMGNQAVQRMLLSGAIRAKLTINEPGDKYEQEADRVADQVISMPGHAIPEQKGQMQQACRECENTVQRQLEKEEDEEAIQTKTSTGSTPLITPEVHAGIDSLHGSGQPLSESERAFFEPRFGVDFSKVRLHSGHESDILNHVFESRAFTYGQHIYFGRGENSTNVPLLAHELAHTIQQGAASPRIALNESTAGATMLRNRYTKITAIQRSVVKKHVKSPEFVIDKINRVLSQMGAWYPRIKYEDKRISRTRQLYALGKAFDPGKGEDLDSNNFVYTCRGGWIDLGHFFFTAFGSSIVLAREYTWKKAVETEKQQQKEREKFERMTPEDRKKYFGASFERKETTQEQRDRRGVAWSAYTIEDLPSDKVGFIFGATTHRWPNILEQMKDFFAKMGAVDASRNKEILKKMMDETLGPGELPRQHRSTKPVLLCSAMHLCPEYRSLCTARRPLKIESWPSRIP